MTSVALSPLANAAAGGSAPAMAQLQLGAAINGRVLALIDDTILRLQLPTGILGVQADRPLAPGTPVTLAVTGTPTQPQLVITPIQSDAGAPDNATLVEPSLALATAIVRDAATRQGGLAALYADLEAVMAKPDPSVPGPVLAAARQLLAMRLDISAETGIDANDIKTALMRSGLASGLGTLSEPQEASPANLGSALTSLSRVLQHGWSRTRICSRRRSRNPRHQPCRNRERVRPFRCRLIATRRP